MHSMGGMDAAILDFIDGLSEGELQSPILIRKATSLRRIGRYADSEKEFRSVIQHLSGYELSSARFELGVTLLFLGCDDIRRCSGGGEEECCVKSREAQSLFKELCSEDLSVLDVKSALCSMRHSQAATASGDLEEAEAVLREGMDSVKSRYLGEYQACLSTVLFLFGEKRDIDAAVRIYRESVENAPDFGDMRRVLEYREWPAGIVSILGEVQQASLSREVSKSSRRGCGCSIVSSVSGFGIWGVFIIFIGVIALMRYRFGFRGLRRS